MEKAEWEREVERILEESGVTLPAVSSAIIRCVQELSRLPDADYEALKQAINYLLTSRVSDTAMVAAFELGRAYQMAKSRGITDVWERK